jgi:hypothetical protein
VFTKWKTFEKKNYENFGKFGKVRKMQDAWIQRDSYLECLEWFLETY